MINVFRPVRNLCVLFDANANTFHRTDGQDGWTNDIQKQKSRENWTIEKTGPADFGNLRII
jgi:hypothetical protein